MLANFHSSAFLTSFVLIFIAELGDKTLYTILLLATRYPARPVLIGACAAFVIQGAIAFALGSVLGLLPHVWIAWITAAVFAFFGVKLLITREKMVEGSAAVPSRKVVVTTFAMVTAAEWGDASQIGTAALVAHLRSPFMVVIGATLGLWLGSALAVLVGRMVGPRIPGHWLRTCAGLLFCAFAVVSVIRG
ncbi:MAG: TMEM165/GDT1 family protein [Thermoanaerobaculia bacterium]